MSKNDTLGPANAIVEKQSQSFIFMPAGASLCCAPCGYLAKTLANRKYSGSCLFNIKGSIVNNSLGLPNCRACFPSRLHQRKD